MMGRHHLISGGITGGLLCDVAHVPISLVPVVIGVTMFFALVPDIDCPGSTLTRSLPVIGPVASWLICGLSRRVYLLTRTSRDHDSEGTHRHLSHTVVFALLVGLLVWAPLQLVVGPAASLILGEPFLPLLVGGAAALGCFTHCLGDSLTVSGCPWLWPLPIRGQEWYELHLLPRPLRFHTGSWVEDWLAAPVIWVLAVLSFPGAWPITVSVTGQLVHYS